MNPSVEELLFQIESAGFRGRIVSAGRLHDLHDELDMRRRDFSIDPSLDRGYLSSFQFFAPAGTLKPRTLIVVAAPQPEVEIVFHWKGKPFPLRVPPTYLHRTDEAVEKVLLAALRPGGFGLARGRVPEKMLAVRSGLARYGRNNVAYVPELGSFHRPVVLFSDYPCAGDSWHEETVLDRCGSCSACRLACPTGAIREDRFLIRGERCLTFLNERPGDFPAWIDPSWHHCLVGCMRCQEACPENRSVSKRMERIGEFTEEETGLLLAGGAADGRISAETHQKLVDLDMIEYKDFLNRNLGVLIR
jgi:epoxyqueuosine reductase